MTEIMEFKEKIVLISTHFMKSSVEENMKRLKLNFNNIWDFTVIFQQ